jgi:hypothetical protein
MQACCGYMRTGMGGQFRQSAEAGRQSKLSRHDFTTSRHIYFALYQTLNGPEDETKLYREFDRDLHRPARDQ